MRRLRGWEIWAVVLGVGLAGSVSGPVLSQVGVDHVSDELIVRFHEHPSSDQLEALRRQFPEIVGWRQLRHAPHPKNDPTGIHPLALVRVAKLRKDGASDAAELADRMTEIPGHGVQNVSRNGILRLDSDTPNMERTDTFKPNDPLYPQQWALPIIDAPAAWNVSMGSSDVVVAVLDLGLAFEHEEFQADAIWRNPGEVPDNGVDDDMNGFIDDVVGWDFISDDNWPQARGPHGTAVAGVIGARLNNRRGIAGLAQVSLMPVAVEVFLSVIVEAVHYAVDSGAHVLNLSFGTALDDSGAAVASLSLGADGDLIELELAMEYAEANGVTVVASAGNDGVEAPQYPAAFDTVIGVSATTRTDTIAEFSNFGDWIGVAAPGESILTTRHTPPWYGERSGTSFAAPHVVGLAALMYSVRPSLSPRQIRGFLYDHSDDLGEPGFDILFGHGRISAARTLLAVEHASRCPSDLNNDGSVDFCDLLAVLAFWGGDHYRADIDEDGEVRFDDLIILLDAWGPCPQ